MNNTSLHKNPRYYIETYGCQMNTYDSELVAGMLKKCGYTETSELHNADAVFLNTCAIREKAEVTVHNRLDSLQYLKKRNPKMIFGVLGCMAQNLKHDLLESKPFVDVILGPDSYRRIPEYPSWAHCLLGKPEYRRNRLCRTKLHHRKWHNPITPFHRHH